MKILFVYPGFSRHAEHHPELKQWVPMNEYFGSPSLGIATLLAVTPPEWEIEYRDDRMGPADYATDADLVALSFFTPAATRGLELARRFKAMGKTVVVGGIFPTMMPHLAAEVADCVVVGEGDEIWPTLLDDFRRGELLPRYTPPACDLSKLPVPKLGPVFAAEHAPYVCDDYPVQLTRGCPLSCQACALPTVMHGKQRPFPVEHVLGQLRQLGANGKRACLTEDTSWFPGANGQKHLAAVLEGLPATGAEISYVGISMPMILSTPLPLLKQAADAGIGMFYLVGGFDPITMRAFTGDDPRQLERAYRAIAKAQEAGIDPYTSFLLGNDDDDEGTVDRMLDFADRSGIRKAEFAIFTPYPGTPAWRRLEAEGRILHRDWSRYNDANVVFRPAKMSPEALLDGYLRLWREFYSGRGHLADLPYAERTIQF